jgi:hypothetical protein
MDLAAESHRRKAPSCCTTWNTRMRSRARLKSPWLRRGKRVKPRRPRQRSPRTASTPLQNNGGISAPPRRHDWPGALTPDARRPTSSLHPSTVVGQERSMQDNDSPAQRGHQPRPYSMEMVALPISSSSDQRRSRR